MISMFQINGAFALGLIALTAGMALVVWMRIHKEHTCGVCRGIAYLIVILAFLTLACTTFYATKHLARRCICHKKMMMHKKMMPKKRMMKNRHQASSGMMMKDGKPMMENDKQMMGQQPMKHQNQQMKIKQNP